jgi:hypothetical protein
MHVHLSPYLSLSSRTAQSGYRRNLPIAGTLRGVSDGTRTRGRRDHNPELYQLSYAHQGTAGAI